MRECLSASSSQTVRKNNINSKCKACGHAFIIDGKLKLASFIVKNPPKIDIDFEVCESISGHILRLVFL